jgi:predicted amidophosphoribosyltransferase
MRALLDLVLPIRCAGCGRPDAVACLQCLAPLQRSPAPAWPRPSPLGLPPPFAVAEYDGAVRRLLLAFKEDGVMGLQRPLGWALARAVVAAIGAHERVVLAPVPSSRAARRQRGEDVVERLADAAARDLRRAGVRVSVVSALQHVRRVQDSAGLSASERAGNLAGAFTARSASVRHLSGQPVVLVDDLITTGVTLAECARALRGAGLEVLACATVAATQRRAGRAPIAKA